MQSDLSPSFRRSISATGVTAKKSPRQYSVTMTKTPKTVGMGGNIDGRQNKGFDISYAYLDIGIKSV